MGEYATLTIWRKLTPQTDALYHTLYAQHQQKTLIDYVKSMFPKLEDRFRFGDVSFEEKRDEVYYSHVPGDYRTQENHQKQCKWNIEPEWLLCFSNDQMSVDGDLFTAEAMFPRVFVNLNETQVHNDKDLEVKRNEILKWVESNASFDDILVLSSDGIFVDWSGDGRVGGTEYVREQIKQMMTDIKRVADCPQWKPPAGKETCSSCKGSGYFFYGTGEDTVCDECGGIGHMPSSKNKMF